jgi:hypothetical protein
VLPTPEAFRLIRGMQLISTTGLYLILLLIVAMEIHIEKLSALAFEGVEARNYHKNPKNTQAQDGCN